jgi:hypothetical protein
MNHQQENPAGRAGTTRRNFLKLAGSFAAAPLFLPSTVLGRAGETPPSERVTVGIIGTGNQGTVHTRMLVALPQAEVLAVCDPHEAKRKKARELVENYAPGRQCADYNDFRQLLERKDIDAVFIASPEHWHALQTIAAAHSGKDVYCEKAMAKTIAESQAMVKAVRQNKRIFQLGTQQRSSSKFRLACELVRNGYIGQLKTIKIGDPKGYPGPKVRSEQVPAGLDYDLWIGPAPMSPYFPERLENLKGWMLCYDYTVGFMSGWGQHNIDIAQWANGTDHTTPTEIEGQATFPTEGMNDTAQNWRVEFKYANGVKLLYTSDDANAYGVRFEGSEGHIFVNREGIEAEPSSILKAEFKGTDVRLYKSDHHHLDFLRSVKTRKDPICPVDTGHHTYTICNLCDIAVRLKRPLRWNPEAEQFPGDDRANAMLERPMRSPWKL